MVPARRSDGLAQLICFGELTLGSGGRVMLGGGGKGAGLVK
jgi:hypothetical protein